MSERERSLPPEEVLQQAASAGTEVETAEKDEAAQVNNEDNAYRLSSLVEDRKDEIFSAVESLRWIAQTMQHKKKIAQKDNQKDAEQNVIFLDQSARPFAAAFQELWGGMYPEEKMPNISFMNIGKEKSIIKPEGENSYHIKWTPELEADVQKVSQEYRHLAEAEAGSTVVVIDDVEVTGNTRTASLEILQRAFPKLNFSYQALLHGDRPHLWLYREKYLGVKTSTSHQITTQSYANYDEKKRDQLHTYKETEKDRVEKDTELSRVIAATIEKMNKWNEVVWLNVVYENMAYLSPDNQEAKRVMEKIARGIKKDVLKNLQENEEEILNRGNITKAVYLLMETPNDQLRKAKKSMYDRHEYNDRMNILFSKLFSLLWTELENVFKDSHGAFVHYYNEINQHDYREGEDMYFQSRAVQKLRKDLKYIAREVLKEDGA